MKLSAIQTSTMSPPPIDAALVVLKLFMPTTSGVAEMSPACRHLRTAAVGALLNGWVVGPRQNPTGPDTHGAQFGPNAEPCGLMSGRECHGSYLLNNVSIGAADAMIPREGHQEGRNH
jgi:hypothetical protein